MAVIQTKMKIVLFGKNGQLGSELYKQAKQLKMRIASYGREEVDVSDFAEVAEVIKKEKPHVIINASAYHVVPDCEAYPDHAFLINTLAVKNLASLSEEHNAIFVHFSTDYVFDGRKGKSYKENDMPNPLQVYGISKLAGEFAALRYCQKSIVIRSAYLYGGISGSRAKKGNFVLTMLKQSEGKDTLEVSSEQIVSPTYAVDIAKATYQLINIPNATGIFHLVNSGQCSLAEFAEQIMRIRKRSTKIVPVDRGGMAGALRRPTHSALSNKRAKRLGVVLPPWKDAVKRYLLETLH